MHEPCSHVVQLYGDDALLLSQQVGQFLGEGLAQGEPALVIAGPRNRDAFVCQLSQDGHDPITAIRTGHLVLIDAATLLDAMMVDGKVAWEGFDASAGAAVRDLRAKTGVSRIRAYGEMVGILWQAGQAAEAAVLEDFWNRLLGDGDASLFCGYPIDLMDPQLDSEALQPLIDAHTHLLSNGPAFDSALTRAISALIGPGPDSVGSGTIPMPRAQALALWLRKAHPERAAEVLARARQNHSTQLRAG